MSIAQSPVPTGPRLSLRERDRRYTGLRAIMAQRGVDAIIVGSFQGRERLESYLSDDFHDGVVILPRESPPILLAFSASRVSRSYESQRRGEDIWIEDIRITGGGRAVAQALQDRELSRGTIGLVGYGPTAPGEMEGLLPLGFHTNLTTALPTANFVDATADFTDFVLLKSEDELALFRFAAAVSERACQAMIEACRPGVPESAVYADIVHEIHRCGCDLRYPFMSLQSGPDNIAWGAPRWLLRAEPPRILQTGDMVQAEIHTSYGGQEAQVQMSVALDPIDADLRHCEQAAIESYAAALSALAPGRTIADIVHAMEAPLRASGCWSKTPLIHTVTFGATGFTPLNRDQLANTQEARIEHARVGIRRGDLVLREGMCLEIEPNACLGTKRVNIGGCVVITADGCEPLNDLATRVHHIQEGFVLS
jgi:Xaa-Pro dipeptidase